MRQLYIYDGGEIIRGEFLSIYIEENKKRKTFSIQPIGSDYTRFG